MWCNLRRLFLLVAIGIPIGSPVAVSTSTTFNTSDTRDALLIASAGDTQLVTAVRGGNGNLKLISWRVANGQIERAGEASAGGVGLISTAELGSSSSIVTVVRDSDGNMKILTWYVAPSGSITRRKPTREPTIGAVSRVAAVGPAPDRLYTAVRDANGNLKVITWDVASFTGYVRRLHEASAGSVTEISLATVGSSSKIVTAARNGNGSLMLITWNVSSSGAITRLDDETAGGVSEISLTSLGGNFVTTSVRDAGGNLKVILWEIAENGLITRRAASSAGTASRISSFHVRGALVATALRAGDGRLKIIDWFVDVQKHRVSRVGEASAGAVGLVSGSRCGSTYDFQTSVRDGSGNLRVIGWKAVTSSQLTRQGYAQAGAVGLISTVCVPLSPS